MTTELPEWAVRLRAERRERIWSQRELARRLVAAADEETRSRLPTRETIVRRIKAYEAGHNQPDDPYRVLYCRVFGMPEDELFGGSSVGGPSARSGGRDVVGGEDSAMLANAVAREMTEFGLWVETTNVGGGTLAYFDEQTRRLAREYLRGAPGTCIQRTSDLARRTFRLARDGHQHLPQTFDLYVIAGKLCALMSWASSDLGQIAAADAYARTGRILADQVGHPALTALLLSAQSKTAFWEARYDEAAQLARQGYDLAPSDSAQILLACQEADAWQAQGAVAYAEAALDRASRAREQVSTADHLGGPFECGPARQANYAMGVYLRARETDKALKAAAEAEQAWQSGDTWAYGTWAQVRIGSAIAHVMVGEVDGAEEALRPVLNLPADRRLATLTARLTHELTPLLDSKPLRRARQALALREQVREYCSGGAEMMRQITSR